MTKVREQHINYISLCDQSQTVAHKLGFFSDLHFDDRMFTVTTLSGLIVDLFLCIILLHVVG